VELIEAHRELERMHRTVLEQEKLSSLGLMAAGVAHEINNPMSYVTSNVRSLEMDLDALATSPELREEYRTEVLPATLDGLERVNAIVRDLGRFSRGDPERFAPYDLNEELRAATRTVGGRVGEGCTVVLDLAEVPRVVGHARQMGQVFVNLLVNAHQAIDDRGGTITVSSSLLADGQVRIQFTDTGCGMSEETLRHLFEPFFTTRPVGKGTGLGLAVAHGIVSSHKGTLRGESRQGQGACFTLVLPLVPPPARASRAA